MATPKKRPDPSVFERYRDEGRNASEVGRLLGVDKNTARKWAADAGVELPHGRAGGVTKWPELSDPDWLLEQLANGLTYADIDRALGCAPGTTKSAAAVLRRRGHSIPIRPSGGRRTPPIQKREQ